MTTRFTLRRSDGVSYLRRHGFECRWFGVFIHHIDGPDPGVVPHDHPWWFASLILRGRYLERRYQTRNIRGGWVQINRRRWSLRSLRLDESHTIVAATPGTVSLVVRGPKVRSWGFVDDDGWKYWESLPRKLRDPSYEEAHEL